MIYTSNYARKGNDPNAIAISVGLKEWNKHIPHLKELAPTWDMVNGDLSPNEYTKQYIELLKLREFDPSYFIQQFPNNQDFYLLCYEGPGDFCHRRILAEYIELYTGTIIPEWITRKEQKMNEQKKIVDQLLIW